ncbi:MAG: GNAT family N-acetyltransferase [Thermoplasmataceae archaeon]
MLWKTKDEPFHGEYNIRRAEPRDAKGVILCMQSVMDERVYLVSEYYLLTERGEQERIRSPDDLTLVSEFGTDIVGVMTIQRGMYRKNRHTGNLGIAIRSNHRGKGLGTRLIREGIKWCGQVGITKLNLEVFSTNVNAISLYKKLGFETEGIRKKQFIIDGEYVDDVLMTYWVN